MRLIHRAVTVLEHVERCWSDSNDQASKRANIAAKALAEQGLLVAAKVDGCRVLQDGPLGEPPHQGSGGQRPTNNDPRRNMRPHLRNTPWGVGMMHAAATGCQSKCKRDQVCACRGVAAASVAEFFNLLPHYPSSDRNETAAAINTEMKPDIEAAMARFMGTRQPATDWESSSSWPTWAAYSREGRIITSTMIQAPDRATAEACTERTLGKRIGGLEAIGVSVRRIMISSVDDGNKPPRPPDDSGPKPL